MCKDLSPKSLADKLEVEVVGFDLVGLQFIEHTRILTLNQDGATIPLTNDLAPESEVIVRNPLNNREVVARVVGLIRDDVCVHIYGIAFLDPSENPWHAGPSGTSPEKSVNLECSRCHTVEVVSLTQIEAKVLESKQVLTRPCACINSSTIWKQTDREAPECKETNQVQKNPVLEEAAAHAPVERRRAKRTAMKVPASIRFSGKEVGVECDDISLGGFRFNSWKSYPAGTRIEASVSLGRSSVNIFVPCHVAYQQELAGGLYRHGVAYAHSSKKPAARA